MANTLPPILFHYNVRLILKLLVICLSVGSLYVHGQPSQKVLSDKKLDTGFVHHLQKRYISNRIKALQIAKKQNWATNKKYAKSRFVTLQGVDSFGIPVYYSTHNLTASIGTHTTELYKGGGLGIDLKGDLPELEGRLCIWDGGMPRLSHVEFGNRIRQKDGNNILSDHSTHLSGTIAATGINPQVKGMAYAAKLDVWDYTDDLVEMAQEASKVLVSNHAYGPVAGWMFNESRPGNDPKLKWEWWGNTSINAIEDYRFGFYDDKAQDIDNLAYNSPFYLIVKSADNKHAETGPPIGVPYFLRNTTQISILERSRNDGYDVIPAEANAKNILTIGGADVKAEKGLLSDFSVASFSGWGPTDDGRIKPDLLGVGTNIISSIASSNNAYATMSGTSTACANVSGTLILLQELFYRRQKYFMRSASLKGLVLHTASKPSGKVAPSYDYGWGLLNAEKAAQMMLNTDNRHVFLEQSLRQNETFQQKIIAIGNEPLIFTVCWTDPEGVATRVSSQTVNNRTPKLVNDLDIRISDDSGNTWFPWVLDPENPAQIATIGDNIRDNVEQVLIANPTPNKVYTITVRHKRTLQNNGQPYSLFISGVLPQDCNSAVKLLKGKDTTLCSNGRVQIQVKGDNALTYQWLKDGEILATTTTPTYEISQKGQYVVKVLGYQCSAQSTPITVKVADLDAKIIPEGSINICSGKVVPLVANTGTGYRYQWQRDGQNIAGEISPTFNPTEAGNYSVIITANNCTATSKPTQLLSTLQRPAISTNTGTVIPVNGSIHLTTNTGDGMTYRWFINGNVISTATGPRLVATLPGKYSVEITQNGCSITSKTLELTHVPFGTNSPLKPSSPEILIIKENLLLYPNPVINTLTVAYQSDNTYDLNAQIITLEGIKLLEKLLFDNGDVFLNEFDVSHLSPGYYLIQVSDGRRAITKPFVKQ